MDSVSQLGSHLHHRSMGNCTSKKSEKLLKSGTAKKPILKKMDKDQDNNNTKVSDCIT